MNLYEWEDVFFHLTATNKVRQIRREGIKADKDGRIFLFTDLIVADTIARDQRFFDKYAVFLIYSEGITGKITEDNVAELSARFHRILYQEKISPAYFYLLGTFSISNEYPTEWDLRVIENFHGLEGKDAEDHWFETQKQMREAIKKMESEEG